MLSHMRTTINLPDGLLERAKRRAAEEGLTLGQLIESAVKERLHRRSSEPPVGPFRLVTYGSGGLQPGLSWTRLKEVEQTDDAERFGGVRGSRAADDDAAP